MKLAALIRGAAMPRPSAGAATVNVPATPANDATAGRALPGVLHIAADPFDAADFGLECLAQMHMYGIVAELVDDAIRLNGLDAASPAAADEADALLALHADDLRAALRAQQGARQAIYTAAGKTCGGCKDA